MRLLSWLSARMTGRTSKRRTPACRPAPGFRPRLEALEARDVPSTLTVTSTADSGAGSLRAEIAAAQSGDTIVFAQGLDGQTITLTSGELVINQNLTIQGPGAGQLTISGGHQPSSFSGSRVFEDDGATATISGLTISNGYATANSSGGGGGGGILNYRGNLTVSDCTLSGNVANLGGGICNRFGTLTVTGCTLSGNQFTAREGYMGGGGIYNALNSWATVTGSTITGNRGPLFTGTTGADGSYGDGGGIYNGGHMTLSATTVTGNTPYEYGGGIYEDRYASLSILNKSTVTNNRPVGDLFLANPYSSVTISSDSHVGTIIR